MGRVAGHRGNRGELTVRVPAGDASLWTETRRFWIGRGKRELQPYDVESSRSYRDRLVLKLAGVGDGNMAAGLRGCSVMAEREQAAALPEGAYWRAELVGLEALDTSGQPLGKVEDVVPTGGRDLLRIEDTNGRELLVPLVEDIVLEVDLERRQVRIDLPEGLRDLN